MLRDHISMSVLYQLFIDLAFCFCTTTKENRYWNVYLLGSLNSFGKFHQTPKYLSFPEKKKNSGISKRSI